MSQPARPNPTKQLAHAPLTGNAMKSHRGAISVRSAGSSIVLSMRTLTESGNLSPVAPVEQLLSVADATKVLEQLRDAIDNADPRNKRPSQEDQGAGDPGEGGGDEGGDEGGEGP